VYPNSSLSLRRDPFQGSHFATKRGWRLSAPRALGSSGQMVKARWVAWAGCSSGKDSRLSFVFEGEQGTSFEAPGRGSLAAERLRVQL